MIYFVIGLLFMKTKIIANYLPQFHEITENNKWWGKGYTDWVAVKKSKPLFDGHDQPRIPLNGYYDLLSKDVIKKQACEAKQAGIYGFGIYHYWFSSKLKLLEKPAEIIEDNKDIDISYMFIWDNCSWKRTWSNVKRGNDWAPEFDSKDDKNESGMLAELIYGSEEDWEIHFNYLLKFFNDSRYIKKDNKPLFAFFQPDNNFNVIRKMCDYWDKRAIECGFNGICFISKKNYKGNELDFSFKYEPFSTDTVVKVWKARIRNLANRIKPSLKISYYDRVWKEIINSAKKCKSKRVFYGAMVGFDDSPRRGTKGRIILGQTPEKFYDYMKQLLEISKRQEKEFVFLTAWNEWGEGAYLEPDTKNGYAYLNALKKAVESVE